MSIDFLLVSWFSIAFWELGKYLSRRRKLTYRWKCNECNFKLKTNNRETFEISKASHNHISTREYKP